MKRVRIPLLILTLTLQLSPVCRPLHTALAGPNANLAIVWRFAAGALALLGSYHAVSAASAAISGLTKYVNGSSSGGPISDATGTVGQSFDYRITVSNPGSDPGDSYNCVPLPPGLTINTALNGNGHITGTPTSAGVWNVQLKADNSNCHCPVYFNATITITASGTPPSFTTQPANATVNPGSPASFTAAASGAPAPALQWRKNGANLSGATGATFTIASASAADAASYDCVASNAAGTATSSAATLSVNAQVVAPSIIRQPQGATVTEGTNVSLTVTANGSAPLIYQWWKNSTLLTGQTSPQLTLNNVTTNQTGNYRVQITNAAGFAKSSPALVTVNPRPAVPTAPSVLSTDIQNGQLVITFSATIGQPHALECTSDLLTATWIVLTNFPTTTSTNLVAYDSLTNGPQRFYRVLTGP